MPSTAITKIQEKGNEFAINWFVAVAKRQVFLIQIRGKGPQPRVVVVHAKWRKVYENSRMSVNACWYKFLNYFAAQVMYAGI